MWSFAIQIQLILLTGTKSEIIWIEWLKYNLLQVESNKTIEKISSNLSINIVSAYKLLCQISFMHAFKWFIIHNQDNSLRRCWKNTYTHKYFSSIFFPLLTFQKNCLIKFVELVINGASKLLFRNFSASLFWKTFERYK